MPFSDSSLLTVNTLKKAKPAGETQKQIKDLICSDLRGSDFSLGEDLPESGIGNIDLKKVRADALLTPSWWMKI